MSKNAPPPYSEPGHVGFVPPPQPHMYPPPPPTQTVIVTHQTVLNLGPQPTSINCPSCHADIVTKVETEASTKTHLFALLLCLFVCWPCVCLPYCMDSCQSQKHYCPNCGSYIGTYAD